MSEHQPQCMTNYFAHAQCDCNAGEIERLRADFAALQHAIVGDTGASAILTAERLRAELAASRERETRMRKLVGFLLIVARTAGDAMPETHARIVSEAEAALAEGAQG